MKIIVVLDFYCNYHKTSMFKMQLIIKLFFFSVLISQQGCQTMTQYMPHFTTQRDADHKKPPLYTLFQQGMKYQQMTEAQQQVQCNKLKQAYKVEAKWQTAWLLVNSLNDDFKCISLIETIALVASIEKAPEMSPTVLWLNKNQAQLFNKLKSKQIKVLGLDEKNKQLQAQIKRGETQIKQAVDKIKALKSIETHVNKKLDNLSTHGQ